jgi:calcium homeostasis ER protein
MQFNPQAPQPPFHPTGPFDMVRPAPRPGPVLHPQGPGVSQPFHGPRPAIGEYGMDVQRDQTGLIIPKAPYYELPAGLMVPLVKATDGAYKPLDSSQIRLPAPRPPSDRLLAVVEDFFAPPSADKPRDRSGN